MRIKMKRFLGILLSLALVLGLMPGMSLTAYANEWEGNPYASLKNTTNVITFDNKAWYLIEDNSTAANVGTVTLLAKECVATSEYNSSDSYVPYDNNPAPTVKSAVDTYYNTISDNAKTAVSGSGMFLLTKDQATTIHNVNLDVLKCPKTLSTRAWWLDSQGSDSFRAAYVDGGNGNVATNGLGVRSTGAVRPALKLDLSKVVFDSSTNTFSLPQSYTPLNDDTQPVITVKRGETTVTSGAPQIGDVLTAETDATDLVYVWYRGNEIISGAETDTYTLTTADVGKTISVKVYQTKNESGTELTGDDRPAQTSTATAAVEKKTNTAEQITTNALKTSVSKTGTAITVTPTSGYEYAVVAKGAAAPTDSSAWKSGDSVTFDGLNAGTEYDVYVRAKGSDDTAPGEATKITVTTNVSVTISGTPTQGQDVTVTLTPEKDDVTYKWYIGDSTTPDGTGTEIVPSAGGDKLKVEVYAGDPEELIGTVTTEANVKTLADVISESTETPVAITLDGPVTGGITIPAGKTVSLDLNGQPVGGGITVSATATLTIEDGSDPQTGTVKGTVSANTGTVIIKGGRYDSIPTATAPGTVTIEGGLFKTSPTVESPYAVKESGNADYPYEVYSTYVALNDAAPTITLTKAEGNTETTPQVGDTLTATPSPANAKPVTYVWYRGNEVIEGATGATYTVTADDVGKTIHAVAKQEANADGNGSAAVETSVSNATAAVEKKTAAELSEDDAKTNGITFTYTGETISANKGYEVSSTNTGDGTAITSLTDILDGEGTPTIYVRTAATDDTAAGAWVEVTLTARPAAPTGLTSEPPAGTADGKIKGTTADMEYKLKDSTGDWTTASASETSVAAGTYLVRTKATDTAPAGRTTEVTILTATDNVSALINALPAASAVTAADKTAIEAARSAYDALTADQKAKVSEDTLKKLTDAEDALAVATVNDAINGLPAANAVTTANKDAIEAARAAYDALTADQKAKVSKDTLKKLTDAEDALVIIQVMSEVSAKTGSGMTYTGSPIQLINTPTTALPVGYTMKYAVTTENQEPAADAYNFDNTSIPTATDAGTYYVWYKVVGDGNHSDSAAACVPVTIKENTETTPPQETPATEAAPSQETPAPATAATEVLPSEQQMEELILGMTNDADVNGSTFYKLQARQKKVTKKTITLTWVRADGASGYTIYGGLCGRKMTKLATVSGTSYTQKKLKSGKQYKFIVVATGGGKAVATSKTIYVCTSGGKTGNPVSVSVNKKSVKLKRKKSFRLNASVNRNKTVKRHRKKCYESTNPAVAKVDRNGKIKAVGKGKCYVFVYAQNGMFKRVKVTVK